MKHAVKAIRKQGGVCYLTEAYTGRPIGRATMCLYDDLPPVNKQIVFTDNQDKQLNKSFCYSDIAEIRFRAGEKPEVFIETSNSKKFRLNA